MSGSKGGTGPDGNTSDSKVQQPKKLKVKRKNKKKND